MFYLEELSIKELQEITGLNKSNVKVKLFRARKKLSEVIKEQFSEIEKYLESPKPDQQKLIIEDVHLAACAYHRFIYKRLKKRLKELNKKNGNATNREFANNWEVKVQKLISGAYFILSLLREIRKKYENDPKLTAVCKELHDIDEFCTKAFHSCLAMLVDGLDQCCTTSNFKKIRIDVKNFLNLDLHYVAENNFLMFSPDRTEYELEKIFNRDKYLKRKIQSSLYLKIVEKPLFSIRKQFGAMFAAALAGGWYLAAAWALSRSAFSGGLHSVTLRGLLIGTTLVLAYVLKDRIKESGRKKFRKGIMGRLPDFSSQIIFKGHKKKHIIGRLNEYVDIVAWKTLPPKVLRFFQSRNRYIPKKVICYRKNLELSSKKSEIEFSELKAIHDILRLNISRYTKFLDDPIASRVCFDKDQNVCTIHPPKNYSMHLVYKINIVGETKIKSEFEYIKLIFNKNGFVRIEKKFRF